MLSQGVAARKGEAILPTLEAAWTQKRRTVGLICYGTFQTLILRPVSHTPATSPGQGHHVLDVASSMLPFSFTDVYEHGSQPVTTAPHSGTDTEGNSRPYSVKMNLICPNPTQALTPGSLHGDQSSVSAQNIAKETEAGKPEQTGGRPRALSASGKAPPRPTPTQALGRIGFRFVFSSCLSFFGCRHDKRVRQEQF